MRRLLIITAVSFFLITNAAQAFAEESLNIVLLIGNKAQRSAYYDAGLKFERENPGISITYTLDDDENYKLAVEKRLKEGNDFDLFYWNAGERLYGFVKQDLIEPIDDLWQQENWDESFTQAMKNTISYKGKNYALPFSYYQWGFYYKKSLFTKLNISPPATWEELLTTCDTLNSNNIHPILIGSSAHWRTAGWFDYLSLRINGLEFHNKLMLGQVKYTHNNVKKVFKAWKELIDRKCFFKYSKLMDWRDSLPYLYRDLAGMTLIGNFVEKQFSLMFVDDIGFFKFPVIEQSIADYEVAPTDVFILSKRSKNKEIAKRFLAFIAQPHIQQSLSEGLGYLSTNIKSTPSNSYFAKKGYVLLKEAEGISQFYDRDTPKQMSLAGTKIFSDFINNMDIESTVQALEKARVQVFETR